MGETHVPVLIRNPAEPQRTWEGLFLVDTGANDCHVPRRYLEAIGLKPKGERVYQLADGRVVTTDTTTAGVHGRARPQPHRVRGGRNRAAPGNHCPAGRGGRGRPPDRVPEEEPPPLPALT